MINRGRTDGRADGRIDTQKLGRYNIIPRYFFLWRGIKKSQICFCLAAQRFKPDRSAPKARKGDIKDRILFLPNVYCK